ncbi:penicillin-binding protein [Virgibacillus profundi]|uniref:Penicillin-binding protein n=1 Tax=Virgibacillus profundi TaxID=2024555 RepID=A0A2A2IG97_9BACI|nr:serine hydrolase domain-containing protein [Virgibacillus profundi]PAV30562.1 penicillin-binding protein [Virgibacillus profundi]PXY54734.1 penicillin-binding protein [Virgibacillus profundi]
MAEKLNDVLCDVVANENFSGVVYVGKGQEVLHHAAYGYSNRAEALKNKPDTRFGIASGCKLFTAVGISMLVEKGDLSFHTRLRNCLPLSFPHFNEEITIHHLLTHSSGIPDYFDEEVMDDFEELWEARPMYKMNSLQDFLPMFQNRKMMFQPGEKFHYNNAGYIVLGLIIEEVTGLTFTDFVEQHIFEKAGMNDSGYYELDRLPGNTATGYIDSEDGWKTNIYSIPVKGGADGGALVTAEDMNRFWDALFSHKLLNEETLKLLLTPHMESDEDEYYGYGIWIDKMDGEVSKYHVMGYDPGVSFHSAVYPSSGINIVIISNKSDGAYDIMLAVEEAYKLK